MVCAWGPGAEKEGEGSAGREFSILTAWWTKLSLILLVLPWRLLIFLQKAEGEEAVGGMGEMGEVTRNAECFVARRGAGMLTMVPE